MASGQLSPVFTCDKTIDTEEMQGLSGTQVFSANGPKGLTLYTLYSRADAAGSYDDVHALSLDGTTPTVALTADDNTLWVGLGAQIAALRSTDRQPTTTTATDGPVYVLGRGADTTVYAATAAAIEALSLATGATHAVATIDTPPTRLAITNPTAGSGNTTNPAAPTSTGT